MATPFIVSAQSDRRKNDDSASYYSARLNSFWRTSQDSLRSSETYKSLTAKFEYFAEKSNDYSGFTMFFDFFHSDYRKLNALLAQDGFDPINDIGLRFGFGSSHKTGRAMIDMYFITAGINNKTEKGNESVKTSFHNAYQFDVGYDVLDARKVSLYPYAGLALRWSTIKYEKEGEANTIYTSIVNMRTDENNVRLSSFRIGYQAGLGLDFTVSQDKKGLSKSIVFIKGGINRPTWKDKYSGSGIKRYDPGIKQGDWMVSIGVKLVDKR